MGFSLPGWPGGDPDALDTAAKAWHTLSHDLNTAIEDADTQVQAAMKDWHGSSAKKFEKIWNEFVKDVKKSATEAEKVSKEIYKIKHEISSAHVKYDIIVGTLAAATVAAIALCWCGIGEAEEAAADAIALASFEALMGDLVGALDTIWTALVEILPEGFFKWGVIWALSDAGLQETADLVVDHKFETPDISDVVIAGLTGGLSRGIEGVWYERALLSGVLGGDSTALATIANGEPLDNWQMITIETVLSSGSGIIDAEKLPALGKGAKWTARFARWWHNEVVVPLRKGTAVSYEEVKKAALKIIEAEKRHSEGDDSGFADPDFPKNYPIPPHVKVPARPHA